MSSVRSEFQVWRNDWAFVGLHGDPFVKIHIDLPDGKVEAHVLPWIDDADIQPSCRAVEPADGHTPVATNFVVVVSEHIPSAKLCDACADAVLEGEPSVFVGS